MSAKPLWELDQLSVQMICDYPNFTHQRFLWVHFGKGCVFPCGEIIHLENMQPKWCGGWITLLVLQMLSSFKHHGSWSVCGAIKFVQLYSKPDSCITLLARWLAAWLWSCNTKRNKYWPEVFTVQRIEDRRKLKIFTFVQAVCAWWHGKHPAKQQPMNNAILWFASQTAYRARSKIRQLWDGEQASKVVVVLHRSDGGKLTEDTGRKVRRKGMSPAVLDVDLEVTLPSLSVLLLAACTKPLYIALLIYKLGPPKTCFEASLPLPVGSREKQSWGA